MLLPSRPDLSICDFDGNFGRLKCHSKRFCQLTDGIFDNESTQKQRPLNSNIQFDKQLTSLLFKRLFE